MKTKSKDLINAYGINFAINNRKTKNAKGLTFTKERNARQVWKSICHHVIYKNSKDDKLKLFVYWSFEALNSANKVKRYLINNFKKWHIKT